MRIKRIQNKKWFVGKGKDTVITQTSRVFLEANEQVLLESSGFAHAITAKEWGFYLTESIGVRVREAGLAVGITTNHLGRRYVVAVSASNIMQFEEYCSFEGLEVSWLEK